MKNLYISIYLFFLCIAHCTSHAMRQFDPYYETKECLSAIKSNDPQKVIHCFSKGANVNYTDNSGKSLFYIACKHNTRRSKEDKTEIIQAIISHPDIYPFARNSYGNTPLYIACLYNLPNIVDAILSKKPQITYTHTREIILTNLRNYRYGDIPLHIAAYHGHNECIEILLSHNKNNINRKNHNGNTALHEACMNKKFDTIKLLIANDARATIKNKHQITPFMMLYSILNSNDQDTFENLLTNNKNISDALIYATDKNNNTQFHLCATITTPAHTGKFEEYLLFLKTHGLNIHTRNNHHKKAVDLACERYNTLYNKYASSTVPTEQVLLKNQEIIMHHFLRLTPPSTQYALLKELLSQHDKDNISLPRDMIQLIICLYYLLNLEAVVAKKLEIIAIAKKLAIAAGQDDDGSIYYKQDTKVLRQQLIEAPEPKLLWV